MHTYVAHHNIHHSRAEHTTARTAYHSSRDERLRGCLSACLSVSVQPSPHSDIHTYIVTHLNLQTLTNPLPSLHVNTHQTPQDPRHHDTHTHLDKLNKPLSQPTCPILTQTATNDTQPTSSKKNQKPTRTKTAAHVCRYVAHLRPYLPRPHAQPPATITSTHLGPPSTTHGKQTHDKVRRGLERQSRLYILNILRQTDIHLSIYPGHTYIPLICR